MTTLYFLDAAEFTDVSAVAAAQPGARVERLPGYVTVTSDGPLVIDRRAAGVRHAIWHSALAAIGHGRVVVQYDKDALKVEPGPVTRTVAAPDTERLGGHRHPEPAPIPAGTEISLHRVPTIDGATVVCPRSSGHTRHRHSG